MPKAPEESGVIDQEAKPAPVAAIEVVALAKGFYKQSRKVEGDKFTVPRLEDMGSWMKCVDPTMQKKHIARLAEVKEKNKAASKLAPA